MTERQGGNMGRLDEPWVVDNPPSERYPIYTRANVGEVFPDPVTPLSWTIAGIPGAEQGWRDALERFGAFDHSEFAQDNLEVMGVFGGYAYLNVSVSRILGVRTPGLNPEMIDYSFFGEQPGIPPYQPRPGDESPAHSERAGATLQRALTVDELPQLDEERRAIERIRDERPDVAALSEAELVARTRELLGAWFRPLFASHLYNTYASTVPAGIINGACAAIGQPGLAGCLIAGLGGVDSAAPSWAMWDLGRAVDGSQALTAEFDHGLDGIDGRLRASRDPDAVKFVQGFDEFLASYGSRGFNEWEMRSPTWETRPELALAAIDRMRLTSEAEAPTHHHAAAAAERERTSSQVLEALAADPAGRDQMAAALRVAGVWFPARERSKTTIIMLVHECRILMRELGRRMVEVGHFDEVEDFGFLKVDELDAYLEEPADFLPVIRERKAWYQELAEREPPFIVVGQPEQPSTWPRRGEQSVDQAGSGDILSGLPGSPGTATGRARVVLDPTDPTALEPGDVLVAPITDPAWTPLFVPAAAVVVDVGAQLSHAIIVSRELGIPCVVSVTEGTRRIPDGALVTVDGAAGTVTVH